MLEQGSFNGNAGKLTRLENYANLISQNSLNDNEKKLLLKLMAREAAELRVGDKLGGKLTAFEAMIRTLCGANVLKRQLICDAAGELTEEGFAIRHINQQVLVIMRNLGFCQNRG